MVSDRPMIIRAILLILVLLLSAVPNRAGQTAVTQTAVPRVYLPLILTPPSKAGVVWLDRQPADAAMLGFTAYYDYSVIDRNEPGVEYIPFFWCDKWPPHGYGRNNGREPFDYFAEAAKHLGHDYDGYLLILNEPDLEGTAVGGQCDKSPREAAWIYEAIVREFPHAKLVGPVVSHLDYWNGWPWMREFYGRITAKGLPLPTVAAIHTYIETEPPEWIVDSHLAMLAEFPGAPTRLWVTEFASCSPARARLMIDTFQAHPQVDRYFWYAARGEELDCLNLFYDVPGYSFTPAGRVWAEEHKR